MAEQILSITQGNQRNFEPSLIHREIEKNIAHICSNNTALIYNDQLTGERRTSYDEMNQKANKIANLLINEATVGKLTANPDKDWLIGVCMHPTDDLIITILAILKTGAAYLPIDPAYPYNRVQHILTEAKPIFVIYDQLNKDWEQFDQPAAFSYIDCENRAKSLDNRNIPDDRTLCKANLAIVEYTSGSTGLPKGVRVPHSSIMHRMKWQFETFPFAPSEKIGVFKSVLTFLDSVPEIWGPLLTAQQLLVVPKEITKDPSQLVTMLEKYELQRLILVPTLLKSILLYLSLQKGRKLLSKLKLFLCTSETLPQSLAMDFYEYFSEEKHVLCNFFGTTEVTCDVTYYIIEGKRHASTLTTVPIGYPIFNTRIYILDDNRKPVRTGTVGELYVSGLNLANGYVNGRDKERFSKNELTEEPDHSRLYRTGDFASISKSGVAYYKGRTDSQIKVRGHRLDLTEIEKQFVGINGVLQSVVLVYHAEKIDQDILAFVVVDAKLNLNETKLEEILKTKLTDYMLPRIILIEKIPLFSSGKTDRQSLLNLFDASKNSDEENYYDYSGIADKDMIKAKILFETIGEVTGHSARSAITIDSNFYEIGGNSLNSIFTVAKLQEKQYGIDITSFIMAKSLRVILSKMAPLTNKDELLTCGAIDEELNLKIIPLADEHKIEASHIVAMSFYEKSELDKYLSVLPVITLNDYLQTIDAIWQPMIDTGFSFVAKDNQNRIVGASFNLDSNNEPPIPFIGGLKYVLSLADSIEIPVKKSLPQNQPVMFSFLMGTNPDLTPPENIAAMTFMEREIVRLAKEKNCAGIVTTNISSLTQQLAKSVTGYKTVATLQTNQFVFEGLKPFSKAPDSYLITTEYKEL